MKNARLIENITLALVVLAILSLIFTILKPGFPSGHDIAAHIVRSKILKDALIDGQFPVRWVEWAWAGSSYPLFNFYQAGFYYLVTLVSTLIPSHIESIKVTVLLMWWLGAGFMFLFTRRFGNLPAAFAALIFAFTPYILSDIFVRAAYPELGAISFSIGFLWALDRLLRTSKTIYVLPLSLCLAGIITFHLPTLVIMSPLFLCYILTLTTNNEVKKKGVYLTVLGTILGFGISAFYLLPALTELKYVKNELLTDGYYDFHPHFVYPQQLLETKWGYGISLDGTADGMSFQFGFLQWLIITLGLSSLVIFKKITKSVIFWLLMIIYAVFFMHDISLAFWENWRFISFIQYPWRFLMVVAVSCSMLAALLLSQIKKPLYQSGIMISSGILIFILYRTFLTPSIFVPKSDFDIDAPNWKQSPGIIRNSIVEEGYMPKEVEIMPPRNINKWEIVSKNQIDGTMEAKVNKNHFFSFVSESTESFIFQLNSHYFLGWKAFIDRQEVPINSQNKYGFMQINIPAGIHQIEFKFTNTPIRSISNVLSVTSLIGLLLIPIYGRLKFSS